MDDKEWKGASFKDEEDYSKEATEALAKLNATTAPVLLRARGGASKATTSSSGSQDDAAVVAAVRELLEPLFALEKVARLGGDTLSCQRVAVEILKIHRALKLYDTMMSVMLDLMKRRAQSKQVQAAMVLECAEVLKEPSLASGDPRVEVLERLAYATENKIHVELQHARFTAELACLHEAKGQKQKSLDMLSSLQVETITTMPRVEKLHILNTQIRLSLELDSVELIPTMSRKISHKALRREETLAEKLSYFHLMKDYFIIQQSYFHVGRCWLEIFLSLHTETQAAAKIQALRTAVIFYLIADYSTEKQLADKGECAAFSPETFFVDRAAALQGLCERFKSDLEDIPQLHTLVKRFNSIVLVRDKVKEEVERVCGTLPELQTFPDRQELLRNRCSEHDLVVVSTFYTRVPIQRLAELVGLTVEHTERFIMDMVANQTLYAKMDRVEGLVEFEARRNTAEVVEYWNDAVERCVSLLDDASHLIAKERMLVNVAHRTA